ncbi:MAG: hypothetical protein R3C61_05620 [Bacteroidia bacterium]
MRPKLRISNLTNLQDARSSAAVGFDLIGFSLERGSTRKLSASLVWNIVNWLSVPGIVLEMNAASLEELESAKKMFSPRYITLPAEEWDKSMKSYADAFILRADTSLSPDKMDFLLREAASVSAELKFEISLTNISSAAGYEHLSKHIFFHFPEIDDAEAYLVSGNFQPYGYALGVEAEEEPGQLNYQRIDDFLEVFSDQFPESGFVNV